MTLFIEKTIKFLGKADNPASLDLLRPFLVSDDVKLRGLAFESMYLKRDSAVFLELFDAYLSDRKRWDSSPQVTKDRLGKIVQAVLRSGNLEKMKVARDLAVELRIYEAMTPFLASLESIEQPLADFAAESIYILGELFYKDLSSVTGVDRANLDRQRIWLATELEGAAKRYAVHHRAEPLQALLMITKKDYPPFQSIMQDIHSAACGKVVEILSTDEKPGYYRLLLGYIDDPDSPGLIDSILQQKTAPQFVRNFLKVIGPNPTDEAKKSLQRFNSFDWLRLDNPDLFSLVEGNEAAFVRLITNMTIQRSLLLALFRLIFKHGGIEGRRAAAEVLRMYPGDDFNALVMDIVNDTDPIVCSHLIRIIKGRNIKDADSIVIAFANRNDETINKTIFEVMPDYRIESFVARMGQYSDSEARKIGQIVRIIDGNVQNLLGNEIASFIPLRRAIACDAIRHTGMAYDFQKELYKIAESDDETQPRVAAIRALSEVLTKEAIVILQNAMQDRSPLIREAAKEWSKRWMENYQAAQNQSQKPNG
ncbi:MAG: HEAT repeat domain-containing protein [Planctomycetaceae bacterium]|jgi:HEAT repeat protein|nr:HEAT repeat domain-containing protein [Planctomycetaceae bacterium]